MYYLLGSIPRTMPFSAHPKVGWGHQNCKYCNNACAGKVVSSAGGGDSGCASLSQSAMSLKHSRREAQSRQEKCCCTYSYKLPKGGNVYFGLPLAFLVHLLRAAHIPNRYNTIWLGGPCGRCNMPKTTRPGSAPVMGLQQPIKNDLTLEECVVQWVPSWRSELTDRSVQPNPADSHSHLRASDDIRCRAVVSFKEEARQATS